MDTKYSTIPSDDVIEKTIAALKANGIDATVVENAEAAKKKIVELIPKGAEVMNMTSETVDAVSLSSAILGSGDYEPVREKLNDKSVDPMEKQRLGAVPEWAVGSVHAVTMDGKVVIASNTGSQLPAYAYGSPHVIWVVGAQKIVKDLDEAFKRIYDYVLPLESERAHKAYGVPGSFVSKLLIINREVNPDRLKMILVKEKLGF